MSNERDWLDGLYAEGSDEQPPAELDTRIKAAARRRIRHPWYLSPGRLTTLATAASLVIAASVIYFGPVEDSPLKDQQPAARILEEAVMEAEQEDSGALKASPMREADNETKRQSPGRLERIRADADMEAIVSPPTEEQAQGPAPAEARSDLPAAAAPQTPPPAADDRTLSSHSGVRSMQADSIEETKASVMLELELLCGPLPGDADNRTITMDNGAWLVTVSDGADRRSWRCQDGAWIAADSEQQ